MVRSLVLFPQSGGPLFSSFFRVVVHSLYLFSTVHSFMILLSLLQVATSSQSGPIEIRPIEIPLRDRSPSSPTVPTEMTQLDEPPAEPAPQPTKPQPAEPVPQPTKPQPAEPVPRPTMPQAAPDPVPQPAIVPQPAPGPVPMVQPTAQYISHQEPCNLQWRCHSQPCNLQRPCHSP